MTNLSLFEDFLGVEAQSSYRSYGLDSRLVLGQDGVFIEKSSSFFEKIWKGRSSFKEENRRTWAFFREKILKRPLAEQKKVRKIFSKHSVNLQKLMQRGHSLQKKHLDLALVALATLYISDLGKKRSPEQISEKIDFLSKHLFKVFSFSQVSEGFWKVYERFFIDPVTREKGKLKKIQELANAKTREFYFEHLAKTVATQDLEEGMILPGPLGEGFYYVYKKIQKGALIAYGLKPVQKKSRLPPVLFFRPTQIELTAKKAKETFEDDFHEVAVGLGGFQAALSDLDQLVRDRKFRNLQKKMVVAGFSLGGAYVQHFLAHGENWKHVQEALLFNSPGVDQKTAETFAKKMNTAPSGQTLPMLSFFRTKKDFIDHGGAVHIGFGVTNPKAKMQLTEYSCLNPLTSQVDLHTEYYQELKATKETFDLSSSKDQIHLNNSARGKEVGAWEKIRQWFVFFRPLILFFISFLIYLHLKSETEEESELLSI